MWRKPRSCSARARRISPDVERCGPFLARRGADAGDGHVPAPDARCVVRGAGGCGARADMPSAEASGAICVQGLDDSRSSAIRITYRISLRSSSIREPRYPSSGVVSATPVIATGGGWFVSLHATEFGRLRSSTAPARARGRVRRMAWGVSRVRGSPTPDARD